MNNKPVLQSPGEKLAGMRTASGRSLPELSEATKIPLPMLQAIESDEYHKISGDLYVKSFLRAYAAEVGLDAEEILTLYGNFAGEAGVSPGSAGAAVWQEEEVEIKRLGLPWGTIGLAAVGVILIAVTAIFLFRGDGQDSGGEVVRQPTQEATTEITQESEPEESDLTISDNEPQPDQSVPVAQEPVAIAQSTDRAVSPELPPVPSAGPGELAIDGQTWPVVLRLVCPEKRGISLKKDADRQFAQVQWPDPAVPLRVESIQAGRAYLTREGLVIFWGAEDHFSLRVDDPEDVKATVNGGYRDISGLGPGEEIILHDPAVINSNLPSARSADRP